MTIPIYRFFLLFSLLTAGLLGSIWANAHGGEDHGDEGKSPAPVLAIAPRALAQSDAFELVAVLDAGKSQSPRLLIIVDRFKTNEPVVGAKLEIDAGGQSVPVKEESPGIYVARPAALNSMAPGAKLPLTISVETADNSDLLTTTLELPATAPGDIAHNYDRGKFLVWAIGAGLVVVALALLIIRRQKKGSR